MAKVSRQNSIINRNHLWVVPENNGAAQQALIEAAAKDAYTVRTVKWLADYKLIDADFESDYTDSLIRHLNETYDLPEQLGSAVINLCRVNLLEQELNHGK